MVEKGRRGERDNLVKDESAEEERRKLDSEL